MIHRVEFEQRWFIGSKNATLETLVQPPARYPGEVVTYTMASCSCGWRKPYARSQFDVRVAAARHTVNAQKSQPTTGCVH